MLWEQWGWEMPQDPQGRGVPWDAGYLAAALAAAVGAGAGHTRGCQASPRVLRVHGTSHHQYPWAQGCAEPQEPPRANPTGRCPKEPSLRQEQGPPPRFLRILHPGPRLCLQTPVNKH